MPSDFSYRNSDDNWSASEYQQKHMAVAFLQNFWRISIGISVRKVDGLTSSQIAKKHKNHIQKNCRQQILVQITYNKIGIIIDL